MWCLAYFNGFGILLAASRAGDVGPHGRGGHALDSIMCRLFAHNNGYPKNLWTVLGFVFGIWAVAVLILLPRRRP